MKEIYSVKLPKHIVFGDPWYFERYSGEELNRLLLFKKNEKTFQKE